ncbi:hypothetical protein [Bradyrhizobium sp. Ai1a-2]|uniref:hypothetical protein n=1 Tax=Bradyrhizobium sp. Ai1a-2 TaxID=196490 RepID=UPI0004864F69|nr:hypothetical protein [Bradyrhizobium sp. Ai1a-2]
MSRGLGSVERACLKVIQWREGADKRPPTTFTVACDVYDVSPDDDGNRLCNNTQHVAVKRALASLQRKGFVIGFRDTYHSRARGDGNIELCHIWMTEVGLARWLAHVGECDLATNITRRAQTIGMTCV